MKRRKSRSRKRRPIEAKLKSNSGWAGVIAGLAPIKRRRRVCRQPDVDGIHLSPPNMLQKMDICDRGLAVWLMLSTAELIKRSPRAGGTEKAQMDFLWRCSISQDRKMPRLEANCGLDATAADGCTTGKIGCAGQGGLLKEVAQKRHQTFERAETRQDLFFPFDAQG